MKVFHLGTEMDRLCHFKMSQMPASECSVGGFRLDSSDYIVRLCLLEVQNVCVCVCVCVCSSRVRVHARARARACACACVSAVLLSTNGQKPLALDQFGCSFKALAFASVPLHCRTAVGVARRKIHAERARSESRLA